MSKIDIIRAWRDEQYRASLSPEERATLPEHPAGILELTEDELDQIGGGYTNRVFTAGCCDLVTDTLSCKFTECALSVVSPLGCTITII